jgi:AraC-like DNA-binding protein
VRQIIPGIEIASGKCSNFTFPVHVHEGHTLGRVCQGTETITARGVGAQAGQGTLYFYHSDEAHSGHSIDGGSWTYQSLYLLPTALSALLDDAREVDFASSTLENSELSALVEVAFNRLATSPCLLEQHSVLIDVVDRILQSHATLAPNRPGQELSAVDRVKDHIRADYTQSLTLGELAKGVDLHPRYLIDAFKRAEGITPHAYLVARRVAAAQSALAKGAAPVDVAIDCGFYDQSHLHRHFLRTTGITPRAYARATSAH